MEKSRRIMSYLKQHLFPFFFFFYSVSFPFLQLCFLHSFILHILVLPLVPSPVFICYGEEKAYCIFWISWLFLVCRAGWVCLLQEPLCCMLCRVSPEQARCFNICLLAFQGGGGSEDFLRPPDQVFFHLQNYLNIKWRF